MLPVPPIPVEFWDQMPPSAQAAILALVQQYEERLQGLQKQVNDLQQRLNQNSTNSSRPPSSDPPHVKRRPPKPSSGRQRGGQPGHAGQQRPLVPLEQIRQTIPAKPSACRQCGQALSGEGPLPRRHWHRVRDGTLCRSSFQGYISGLRAEVSEALTNGAACGCRKTAAACRDLIAHERKLWAFVWREGIEPTNNAAERGLRDAVLWRKGSGGTDSQRGSRFVERVLSMRETCRQQGRGLLECCEAHWEGKNAPSLLPKQRFRLGVA